MKTIVVIPTYDEIKNVAPMAKAVLGAGVPDLELLFVDDNSPDGTGDAIEALMKTEPCIRCLHRAGKEGLGRAYVAGFAKALELGADLVIQMDCDFSHDPKDIARLVEAARGEVCNASSRDRNVASPLLSDACGNATDKGDATFLSRVHEQATTSKGDATFLSRERKSSTAPADLVIGSRYVPGGSTPGWPFKRRLISRAGGVFIRTVTGMPLRDPTGGFKCWRASTLRKIDFATVGSKGYSFQLEMNHRAWKAGCVIKEIPITFTDRVEGYSKITPGIATESIKIALRLRFAASKR